MIRYFFMYFGNSNSLLIPVMGSFLSSGKSALFPYKFSHRAFQIFGIRYCISVAVRIERFDSNINPNRSTLIGVVPVQSQWYELQDDYYIPCLILSEEETQPIGLWGQRHKQYLKEHKHLLYTTMLIEGTLNSYLADIDKQAQERLLLLTKQIAEQENVTEQLKADNAMLWVQKMNEIQSRVREIIYNEIIYA